MCQLATLTFSSPGPSTNLLFLVIKDGVLNQHWFSSVFNQPTLVSKRLIQWAKKVQRHVSIVLHILVDHHNVVGWLVLNYMWTSATGYYLEYGEQATYMETHTWWSSWFLFIPKSKILVACTSLIGDVIYTSPRWWTKVMNLRGLQSSLSHVKVMTLIYCTKTT